MPTITRDDKDDKAKAVGNRSINTAACGRGTHLRPIGPGHRVDTKPGLSLLPFSSFPRYRQLIYSFGFKKLLKKTKGLYLKSFSLLVNPNAWIT